MRIWERRGSTTVEFVLILPLLLLVLFLSVELCRAWLMHNLAQTAAHEGLRAAIVAPPTQVTSVATARINQLLGQGQWSGSVSCNPAPCGNGSVVTASVTVNFSTVLPNLVGTILKPLVLTQTLTMQYEYPPS